MRQVSPRKARQKADRRKLMTPARCEVGPVFLFASCDDRWEIADRKVMDGIVAACNHRTAGKHERRKRSSQGSLTHPENLMDCCSPCNSAIEDHPRIARMLGLVVRPGDPEWDELGAAPSKSQPLRQVDPRTGLMA
jgi:hypothetical protein